MQNSEGAAAALQRQQQIQGQVTAAQRVSAESLALLREAVLRLTQQAVRDSPIAAPTSRLTFLTGPAQQAGQDLSAETAGQYPALKQTILAYYGHNLAARALRFHDWRFDVRGPVHTQIAQHGHLARRWLATGEGPSALDRVIIDSTIRPTRAGS